MQTNIVQMEDTANLTTQIRKSRTAVVQMKTAVGDVETMRDDCVHGERLPRRRCSCMQSIAGCRTRCLRCRPIRPRWATPSTRR